MTRPTSKNSAHELLAMKQASVARMLVMAKTLHDQRQLRSADAVRKLVEEPRSSLLCRVLEDVQAVVAAWREFSSPPTQLKDAT